MLFGPEENVTGRKTKQKRSELWAKVKRERREHNTQAEPPHFFRPVDFFSVVFLGPAVDDVGKENDERRKKPCWGHAMRQHTFIRLPVPIAGEGCGRGKKVLERPWCGFVYWEGGVASTWRWLKRFEGRSVCCAVVKPALSKKVKLNRTRRS